MTHKPDGGISIITVVFNGESYIDQTILSVIDQKNINLEYIIIDGGSTDGTLQKISGFRGKIDVVVSEPDNGIYHAINKGLQRAKFDIIGIIHCGDFYEPGILQAVQDEFHKSNADIVYGDVNFLQELKFGNITTLMKADHFGLKRKMTIFHPGTFVSKRCYNDFGVYNTDYIIAADYDFLRGLFQKGLTFRYIPLVLSNFRVGGISGSRHLQLMKENFMIHKSHGSIFSACRYLFPTIIIHLYFSLRKAVIGFLIGKKNYEKLIVYRANRSNASDGRYN